MRAHLEQLLIIRKWQRAGLSLERIRELSSATVAAEDLPPERPRRPGDITVRSHVLLRPGVELVIQPGEAGLTPEAVRALAKQVSALFDQLQKEKTR